jgi:hypothetical protein
VLDRSIDAQADLIGALIAGKPPTGTDLEARIALFESDREAARDLRATWDHLQSRQRPH